MRLGETMQRFAITPDLSPRHPGKTVPNRFAGLTAPFRAMVVSYDLKTLFHVIGAKQTARKKFLQEF